MSQTNLRVVGNNGKLLGGGAAQLRRIKESGGWDAYHEKLIRHVAQKVCAEVIEEMSRPMLKAVK